MMTQLPNTMTQQTRRSFLGGMTTGLTGLALHSLLQSSLPAAENWQLPTGKPHFPPRAKSVIWLFMRGGVSHMESFDPKPALTKYAGKTISETPFGKVQDPDK